MKTLIKLLDQAFAHCNYSNNPLPPLQEAEWIEWDRTMFSNTDLLFVTDHMIKNPVVYNREGITIAWLLECRIVHPELYDYILHNYDKFDIIITHDRELVSKISNSIWIPFGGCWIHKDDWKLHTKTKLVSIVASEKNFMPGHMIRHQIISTHRSIIDLFGRGYNPIQNKIESLREYKYQIVIENAIVSGYFTEKLIDCFMTGTIPIYIGDPDINLIFDTSGMIIINDINELRNVIDSLTNIKYTDFIPGISNNFEIAKKYILSENYIYESMSELLTKY